MEFAQWKECVSGEAGLSGREHNSPKSAPYLSITIQSEQTTAWDNVLNAAACSDWAWLCK